MSFLDAIAAKPWLPQAAPPPRAGTATAAATVGLRVFLGVISALFGLLTIALLVRSRLPDWQALVGVPGAPLVGLGALWLNTALLAASSVALQAASSAARREHLGAARLALALGGILALAFLGGQGAVWQQFMTSGHFVASNPATSFFYLLTGLHGLHLAGGLVALARATMHACGEDTVPQLRAGASLCALYWHFLFAVWLLVFALLASPPETLATLADICGIG